MTEYLDKKLCEVYESERIFDKFDLQVSPDSTMVLTGSYHGHGHVIDMQRRINTTIDVRFMDKRGKHGGTPRFYKGKRLLGSVTLPPNENSNTIVGASAIHSGTSSVQDGSNSAQTMTDNGQAAGQ